MSTDLTTEAKLAIREYVQDLEASNVRGVRNWLLANVIALIGIAVGFYTYLQAQITSITATEVQTAIRDSDLKDLLSQHVQYVLQSSLDFHSSIARNQSELETRVASTIKQIDAQSITLESVARSMAELQSHIEMLQTTKTEAEALRADLVHTANRINEDTTLTLIRQLESIANTLADSSGRVDLTKLADDIRALRTSLQAGITTRRLTIVDAQGVIALELGATDQRDSLLRMYRTGVPLAQLMFDGTGTPYLQLDTVSGRQSTMLKADGYTISDTFQFGQSYPTISITGTSSPKIELRSPNYYTLLDTNGLHQNGPTSTSAQ